MITKTGYRQMLRDRTPKVVIYALKWCKATDAWLDHVYNNWIWMYSSKKDRLEVTRNLLGLRENKPQQFVFEDTIMRDNLNEEQKKRWNVICDWVSWFVKNHAYIENAYDISKKRGKNIIEVKTEIISNYLKDYCPTSEDGKKERERKNTYVNKLCDFLINSFENRI